MTFARHGCSPMIVPRAILFMLNRTSASGGEIWASRCPAYIFGITALIGVIIAHTKWPDTGPLLRSHYQFQIRTFWIGLLYLVVGAVLAFAVFPVIAVAVLIWWFIWSLV